MARKKVAFNSIVLYPPDQGGIQFKEVYNALGSTWLYEGRFIHLLYKKNDKLEAYEPPDEIKVLPDKLYRAMMWEPVKRLLAYKSTLLDKVNMGLGVVIIGTLAFTIFLVLEG